MPTPSPKSENGNCAMMGHCGSKSFGGKLLPCPYDGPAIEVCFGQCYRSRLIAL